MKTPTAFVSRALGLCALGLALAAPSAAQSDIVFENITTAQGLSQNTVTSILQDQKGYLWFGTRDGLNRYDGYGFRIYRLIPGEPNSLVDNIVLAMIMDRDGKLWIGTEGGGISIFDTEAETFTNYSHDRANADSLSHNQVFCLREDREGVVWIGTADGLNAFKRDSGKFVRYRHDPANPNSLIGSRIQTIYEDRRGALWVGTTTGLSRFDRATGGFVSYVHDPRDRRSLNDDSVIAMYEDRADRFWIGTMAGLTVFDPDRSVFGPVYTRRRDDPRSLGDDVVRTITEDRQSRLWIGTQGGGISIMDAERKAFTRLPHDPSNPGGLKGVEVRTIFEDRGGTIWIGTYIRGINKHAPGKLKFSHFLPPQQDPGVLDNLLVRSFFKDDDGILWVGTQGGLNRFDRKTGRSIFYGHNPADPSSLSHSYVWAILKDRTGVFWLGTRGGGLNKFDPRTGRSVHFRARPGDLTSLCQDEIRVIVEDRRGRLWIGTLNGLNEFDPKTETFTAYRHDPADPASLSSSRITAIRESKNGRLWIATDDGLNEFERERKTFRRTRFVFGDQASPSDNRISSLWEGTSGELWLSTYGSGFIRFDPVSGAFQRFGEAEGLANNNVYGVLGDAKGMLWMSTNGGISRFNPDSREFANFDESDGVQGREFNSCAYLLAEDGEMFFGGMNGFNAFFPATIVRNEHIPPIVLTDFKISNVSIHPIPKTREIKLSYRDHLVSFDFAALDFQAPEKNQYAYALEEENPRWMRIGTRRSVNIDLKPGRYLFRVKGANNDGVWNEEGIDFRIDLRPPLWQTWWFRILLVAALLAAVSPILAWPHKKRAMLAMKEARDAAEASNRAKSFFLANMSHELRTPLNAIIGYSEMLQEDAGDTKGEDYVDDLKKIQGAGKHLLSLINDILDLSKVEAGKMELHVEPFELRALLKEIEATIQPLVEKNGNSLRVTCPEAIGQMTSDFTRVRQVLFNLLSNACKFTEKGVISLDVSRRLQNGRDTISIIVRDSGIGMTPEQMKKLFQAFSQADASTTKKYGGTGLGLAISKRLCEMMGGSVSVESEPGKGSVFTVVLPADGPSRPAAVK